jgi:hypothetical protein
MWRDLGDQPGDRARARRARLGAVRGGDDEPGLHDVRREPRAPAPVRRSASHQPRDRRAGAGAGRARARGRRQGVFVRDPEVLPEARRFAKRTFRLALPRRLRASRGELYRSAPLVPPEPRTRATTRRPNRDRLRSPGRRRCRSPAWATPAGRCCSRAPSMPSGDGWAPTSASVSGTHCSRRYFGKARRDLGEPAAADAWGEGQATAFDDAVIQALSDDL